MSGERRLSKLNDGGIEVVNNVLKYSPEGSLAYTIAKNVANERKAFLDSELRTAITEVLFSEDDVENSLFDKLSSICVELADCYSLSPEQLSRVMDEIYEEEQTKIYG